MAEATFVSNKHKNDALQISVICKVNAGERTSFTTIKDGLSLYLALGNIYKKEYPCPDCHGGKMKCYDADEFGNTTREVKCETCKNTGIYIPKSEA